MKTIEMTRDDYFALPECVVMIEREQQSSEVRKASGCA